MPRIDSEKFYTSAIEMHGTSAKGVNWASKENQIIRFQEILKLLPEDLENFSLVDAGCGFGDFYLYLKKKKRLPNSYVGIDSLVDMYSIASQNTAQEILIADICTDSLPNADYYICSGALNVLTKFETHQFIQNCYNSSKKGFIFNALEGEKESETYNYIKGVDIAEMAKDLRVRELICKGEYLANDITVGFFR